MLFLNFETNDDYNNIVESLSSSSSSSLNLQRISVMGEDDIVELLWKSNKVIQNSETNSDPPLLRSGGSIGGGDNASHQNIFIQEDEMASWLQYPPLPRLDGFYSGLLYSAAPTPSPQLPPPPPCAPSIHSTLPQSSVSLPPPPPPPPPCAPSDIFTTRRVESFMNLARLTGPGQVGSSLNPSSSGIESCLTPAVGRVSPTFVVRGKEKAVVIEPVVCGTSSLGVCKVKTGPIQVQPATETDMAHDRKRKERQETIHRIKETEEAQGSASRKRSRTAEMHNNSERRRREKINEKMKALQELIPRCNKTDKASMLDDAVEYVKSLQQQIQMISMGSGMMYPPNMQQFMPPMPTGMNRPPFIPFPGTAFPMQPHMGGLSPSYPAPRYPFTNIQASDPSRVHLPNQQPFPGYMNPYTQFAGLHQVQQPPPLQVTFNEPSSSKEHEN